MQRLIIGLPLLILMLISCSRQNRMELFENGVSKELAVFRKEKIDEIHYHLLFHIPSVKSEPVTGTVRITFAAKPTKISIPLDFRVHADNLISVTLNGDTIVAQISSGHILLPAEKIIEKNEVAIQFIAGDQSLNRNESFLYTLLVPDRASTLFPCFDQPDLKATFSLSLNIPVEWKAIANSGVTAEHVEGERRILSFGNSKPISTYLFAFCVGQFESVTKIVDGLEMEMLHRETDTKLVSENSDEIFKLHAEAVRWMEEYTAIDYPFDKFGFAIIPSFQYGGMEHPGAIFYRSSSLFLQPDASINQHLGRAGLIAHETSHMWFGDLVTMSWFDDVWLKEVFAGYMADKIVNPSFPEVNHDLKFLLSRYPAAYAIDRTIGANPVIQPLDNLINAGSLYGGIIYNKAPIVMKHLELIIGGDNLRLGLQQYLSEFSYGNAEWADLITILDEFSQSNLDEWSNIWVREPGMPTIEAVNIRNESGSEVYFRESDPYNKGRHWPQTLNPLIISQNDDTIKVTVVPGQAEPINVNGEVKLIIADYKGIAYGTFLYEDENIDALIYVLPGISDPIVRSSVLLSLWENMLNSRIAPEELLRVFSELLAIEKEQQVANLLRGRITTLYWNWIDPSSRSETEITLTKVLKHSYNSNKNESERKSIFNTWSNIAISKSNLDSLANFIDRDNTGSTVKLSEDDKISIAASLLLKGHPQGEEIFNRQYELLKNPDRREKMAFIRPSLSQNKDTLDAFFESLKDAANREREPWVLEALGYLHHPLKTDYSEKYLPQSLLLLEEIKLTGDIFFPFGWVSNTFDSYRSPGALEVVNRFLDENPDYPADLKLKILQATDHLHR